MSPCLNWELEIGLLPKRFLIHNGFCFTVLNHNIHKYKRWRTITALQPKVSCSAKDKSCSSGDGVVLRSMCLKMTTVAAPPATLPAHAACGQTLSRHDLHGEIWSQCRNYWDNKDAYQSQVSTQRPVELIQIQISSHDHEAQTAHEDKEDEMEKSSQFYDWDQFRTKVINILYRNVGP